MKKSITLIIAFFFVITAGFSQNTPDWGKWNDLIGNWTGEGNQIGASYGMALGPAGDVNGDGYDDVILGTHNVPAGIGAAHIVFGGLVGSETLSVGSATASDAHVATSGKFISAVTLADATDGSGGTAADYKLPATRRLAAALARSRLADGMNLNQVDQGNFARRRAQARAGATDSGAGFTAPSRLRRKASNINSDHKGAL